MPLPEPPVKIVSYADDITIYATGYNIRNLVTSINKYLSLLSTYFSNNKLNVSTDKSNVTLFTNDPKQFNYHPHVRVNDKLLPLSTPHFLLTIIQKQ